MRVGFWLEVLIKKGAELGQRPLLGRVDKAEGEETAGAVEDKRRRLWVGAIDQEDNHLAVTAAVAVLGTGQAALPVTHGA